MHPETKRQTIALGLFAVAAAVSFPFAYMDVPDKSGLGVIFVLVLLAAGIGVAVSRPKAQ